MCGRYYIELDTAELRDIISKVEHKMQDYPDQMTLKITGEIFPGDTVPVITGDDGARSMTWGFPNAYGKRPHINARSESAATSKTFGEAMASRRCLVPASGYYEWKTLDAKRKEKYEFTLSNRAPLYMAGIYSPDGRFAILTRDAAPGVSAIHDRMPVIFSKSIAEAWLLGTPDVLREALTNLSFSPVKVNTESPPQMSLFE